MTAVDTLREVFSRYPNFRRLAKFLSDPFRGGASRGYATLRTAERDSAAEKLKDAWRSPGIPARQRIGVDKQLAAYRDGRPIRGFDVLVDILRPLVAERQIGSPLIHVVEIGCASGYHFEVMNIKGLSVVYSGCDYSPGFVEMARRYYPSCDFRVEDATALSYADRSFDVVISGCCLLHIPAFEAAISEASRVARSYVVFHCTPVLHLQPTTFFTKLAYDVPTIEIHFNEQQLVDLFFKHGLRIIGVATLFTAWKGLDAQATKSYLCEKVDHTTAEGNLPNGT